eukprot:TRINITY_DN405_c0_g1_i1.p1 TRINITY_DN405_c0_g1~~TRINITY_DN405_c0_g1_i1.p1  ORF type:complete len:249 (+),score=39.59 TRINITY_DN405_c0_g1_i1:99-845(+)
MESTLQTLSTFSLTNNVVPHLGQKDARACSFSDRLLPCRVDKRGLKSNFKGTCINLREAFTTHLPLKGVAFSSVSASLTGEDPEYEDSDYIALGLAHCFITDENAKLQDYFVIEPIPAGALECMDNGGVTSYLHAIPTNLGIALKQDLSLLPEEFSSGNFCEDYDFRVKCASRTWKRDHAMEHIMKLLEEGKVRSDWNFSVENKRVLNVENVVTDDDNIKQDLSIDVYGRANADEDATVAEVEKLYNV